MNWRIGQRVVCISDDTTRWVNEWRQEISGPANGDVLRVRWAGMDNGKMCLAFEEWPAEEDVFDAVDFRPLDNLEEQLERIQSEGVTITEPQPQLA